MDEGCYKCGEFALKVILFDFDGTLADTMHAHWNAWQNALFPLLPAINRDEYFLLEGESLYTIARKLNPTKSHDDIYIKKLIDKKISYFNSNSLNLKLYPGVESVITKLHSNGYLIGIVTSSVERQLAFFEDRYKTIFDKFRLIITGDMFGKGKPDPEGYILAMSKLNASKEDCLIVENSILGVEAARNAHVRCIAITNTLEKSYLGKADAVISSFEELETAVDSFM